jgi:hypothetical protein
VYLKTAGAQTLVAITQAAMMLMITCLLYSMEKFTAEWDKTR